MAALRNDVIENVGVILRRVQPERAHAFRPELFSGVDDETLVNTLSNALAFPAQEKQMLLEAHSSGLDEAQIHAIFKSEMISALRKQR